MPINIWRGERLTLNKLERLDSLNIPAVALTADYIQKNPGVWSRLEAGVYSVVLASPEILLVHGSVFLLRVVRNRTCAFTKRLACIAIDEAHLVWGWRTFRKDYAGLSTLRHCYPKVPLMALSATLTPNVLEYIRKSLNMRDSVRLYKRPMDRPNIMQMVAKIKTPKEFDELAFLVPTAGAASAIPKTMVFVDSLDDGMTLAHHLRNLLPAHMKNNGERIIRT